MYVVSYFSFLMSSVTRVILISFFLFSSEKEGREEEREGGRKGERREEGREGLGWEGLHNRALYVGSCMYMYA